jgi:hypothetical protein
MNTGNLNKLIELFEHCQELRDRLGEARKDLIITGEQWEAFAEGPFGEILDAAVAVEAALEICEES